MKNILHLQIPSWGLQLVVCALSGFLITTFIPMSSTAAVGCGVVLAVFFGWVLDGLRAVLDNAPDLVKQYSAEALERRERKELRARANGFAALLRDLNAIDLSSAQQALRALRLELKTLQKKADQQQAVDNAAELKCAELQAEVTAKRTELKQVRRECHEQTKQLQGLRAQLVHERTLRDAAADAEKNRQIAELQRQIAEQVQKNRADRNAAEAEFKREKMLLESEGLHTQRALEKQLDDASQAYEELQRLRAEESSRASEAVATLKSRAVRLEQLNEQLLFRCEQLKLARAQSDWQTRTAASQGARPEEEALRKELEECRTYINELEDEVSRLDAERERYQTRRDGE